MPSVSLAQMCSGPPKKSNHPPAPAVKAPSQMASAKTTSYSTLHNWGPVVVRTMPGCNVERMGNRYSSETHDPETWEKIMDQIPGRERYAKYNSGILEENTIVGTNDRRANYGATSQYGCAVPDAKECYPVIISDEGTVAGSMADAEVAVCLYGEEILNVDLTTNESDCAAKCSNDALCAAYTFTGNQCILQNGLIQTRQPGFILGQYSDGLKTRVRHCNFAHEENGDIVCQDEPSQEKNCFGPFPPDRFDITQCHTTAAEGEKHFFERMEVLQSLEWKAATTVEPGVPLPANDSSAMPVFEEKKQ